MFAQPTHAVTMVTAGGGLSSSYSAVADAVTAIPVLAADAAEMITTAAVLSSGF